MTAILDATIVFDNLPPRVEARPNPKATDIGAVLHIPANVCADDPIVIRYRENARTLRSHIVVIAERGARATILERIDSTTCELVESTVEILAGEHAHISYATLQTLPQESRVVAKRTARCERGATVAWSSAQLGAAHTVESIDTEIAGEGAHVDLTALFFPNGSQYVDLTTSIDHTVGHATSETLVKSAATGHGQGRYLGMIRIAKDAQGSDARLRDDALLLSKTARIDSVPALEIAANDVKAFHGATVGAIDAEQLFYMESRGIPKTEAENMIALGFFEPAIDRFPTEALREEIRKVLTAKIT